jgi:hypothetical protein
LYDEEGGVKSPEIYKPGDPPLLFSFEELKAATDGFSGKALLGGSGFGRVYMGKVDGTDVVVKRLNELQVRRAYFCSGFLCLWRVFEGFEGSLPRAANEDDEKDVGGKRLNKLRVGL